MVNSTAKGGGVAEMLPRLISIMQELGIDVRWAVINSDQEPFFQLTKRIHNLIHGDGRAGTEFTAEDRQIYETVNRINAEAFKPHLGPDDLLFVHDPQPLPLGQMLARELGVPTVWRCHIGLDKRNAETRAVWRFLRPYLDGYQHAVFSIPEYVPGFVKEHSSIIYPALDPLSHKNRHLQTQKVVGVLCNSGLQKAEHPLVTEDYQHQVKRVTANGEAVVPRDLGLLFRPVITQISRWDRLKGWLPLMEGFVRMKRSFRETRRELLDERFANRIDLCRLVLAGPDPASIADDPEGLEVFEQICSTYRDLDAALREEIVILELPMQSLRENALIVNALQRCSSIVVQNSLREGFGLTVSEAMWKGVAVLGSSACGIRLQVRHGVDGLLTEDANSAEEIATNLRTMIARPRERDMMGRNAQRRVYDEFLVFRQVTRYLDLFRRHSQRRDESAPIQIH
jgi:trehalose synthase